MAARLLFVRNRMIPKTKSMVLMLCLYVSSFCGAQGIYREVAELSFQNDQQGIIKMASAIESFPDRSKRNDMIIVLAYAYLNTLHHNEFERSLSLLNDPTLVQQGFTHELFGIKALSQQQFSKAANEFKSAMQIFALTDNLSPYFESTINFTYASHRSGVEDANTNIFLDRAIDHCITAGDSSMQARALLVKSLTYPIGADGLFRQVYEKGPISQRSTVLFYSGTSTGNLSLLYAALDANPTYDYCTPVPLKLNEREEIRLSIAQRIIEKDPREAIKMLLSCIADSAVVAKPITVRALNSLSGIYTRAGKMDSSNYYSKLASDYAENFPESKLNASISLDAPAPAYRFGGNPFFLWGAAVLALAIIALSYFFTQSLKTSR